MHTAPRTPDHVVEEFTEAVAAVRDAERAARDARRALRSLSNKLAIIGQPGFLYVPEGEDAA